MKAKIRDNSIIIKENIQTFTRNQKRAYCRKAKISKQRFSELFEQEPEIILDTITEGSKVKLRYDRIMETAADKSEKYSEFVEQHKDEIMTIEYDARHTVRPTVFCLAEDTNPVKWLFDISDLEVIEMMGGTEIIEEPIVTIE